MRSVGRTAVGLLAAVVVMSGCGDDEGEFADASMADGAAVDGASADAPGPDANPVIARGKYLVDHVAACGDCHTPRLAGGAPDLTRYLAGNPCLIDLDQGNTNVGCLATRNLTNHSTGLMNRTDAQIKTMFTAGTRPGGEALNPFMPYWVFANMTVSDQDAIVAYLRTVTGVNNMPTSQPPFNVAPAQPATAIDPNTIPMPAAGATQASAMRGRYLAGMVGACIDCHTPELPMAPPPVRPIDMTKPFAGGRAFPRDALGLPPVFPMTIYTANLTPHATTGLTGYDAAKIVRVLKQGRDKDNAGVCPPMPTGPMGAFGGLTDQDAMDIANYILSLPGVDNMIPNGCMTP